MNSSETILEKNRLITIKLIFMIKKLTFAFAAMVISVASYAQSQFEWKEAKSGGYTYKYVTNDPTQARFYTLKNGLTVILSPTKKDPRIQAYVAIKAGSKTDPATNTGLAHYLEHMLFKGTDKYGSLFFFSSRRRHTRCSCDWSSDVCSSDLVAMVALPLAPRVAC